MLSVQLGAVGACRINNKINKLKLIGTRHECKAIASIGGTQCVGVATAVTFSIKHFNPLELYLQSGNIFRKWSASYFVLFTSI